MRSVALSSRSSSLSVSLRPGGPAYALWTSARRKLAGSQRRRSLLSAAPVFLALLASSLQAGDLHAEKTTVKLETNHGTIVLALDDERAPETVQNFLDYVNDGFYDGTIFHRVIDGFMIQGGGFTTDYRRKPVRDPIGNEANNGLRNKRYTVAMARTNAPHSATSQFFINTEDNTNLDHTNPSPRGWGYAVFGEVIDGTEVVDRISEVATGAGGPFSRDAPREQVVIESASRMIASPANDESSDEKPASTTSPTGSNEAADNGGAIQ